MSRLFPRMNRYAALLLALVWTALTFGTALTPAPAVAGEGAYYRATLAAPAPEARMIARGTLWLCNGANCGARKDNSRPAIVCARLAREAGPVTAFSHGGEAFDAEELAECND